jgi:hypothetical protein
LATETTGINDDGGQKTENMDSLLPNQRDDFSGTGRAENEGNRGCKIKELLL